MIEKKTIVDTIEIKADGMIQFRLGLQVVEDGEVISNAWHRSAVQPGGDVDAQMALVNTHLVAMGKKPVSAEDITRLKGVVAPAWTPKVVTAYGEKMAAIAAAEEAERLAAEAEQPVE